MRRGCALAPARTAAAPWLALALCALAACTDGAPTPARDPSFTSADLIDAAARAGAFGALDQAWYRFLADVAPGLLPDAYRAAVATRGPPDVSHYAVLREHVAELDASRRDVFRALTARPDAPAFLTLPSGRGLAFGAGTPTCESLYASPARAAVAPGGPVETRHFSFVPVVRVGAALARDGELRQRVTRALAATTGNLPGAAPATLPLGDYLDAVFEHYRGALGLASPVAEGARVAVYVATCDGELNTARAYEGHIFAGVGLALEEPTFRRVVLPHELAHLFQLRAVHVQSEFDAWPFEAMATYVEDLVAPDVRRWRGGRAPGDGLPAAFARARFDRAFQCFEEDFHAVAGGRCRAAPAPRASRVAGPGDYSRFALFHHLAATRPGFAAGGLARFLADWAAAGGDPRRVVTDDLLARFGIALVGDASTPGFPADFAADLRALGPPPEADEAYTLTFSARALAESPARRATPPFVDDRATSLAEPLEAHATHRWRIDLPADAGANHRNYPRLAIVQRGLEIGASPLGFALGELTTAGAAPAIDLSSPGFARFGPQSAVIEREVRVAVADDRRARTLVAFVTTGEGEYLRYDVAVNLPARCAAACEAHYAGASQGCYRDFCEYACLNRSGLRVGADARPGLCADASTPCLPPGSGLGLPYDDVPALAEPRARLCAASGFGPSCGRFVHPAGFVPVARWPALDCAALPPGPCMPSRVQCSAPVDPAYPTCCSLELNDGRDCYHDGGWKSVLTCCAGSPCRALHGEVVSPYTCGDALAAVGGATRPGAGQQRATDLPALPRGGYACGSSTICTVIWLCAE